MSEQQCKDFRKLCIKNVNESEIDLVLSICEEYARVTNHNVHHNRNGNKNQCMLFPNFNSTTDASKAKDALTARGHMVDYANTKRVEPQSPPPGTSAKTPNASANFDANDPYGICIRCGQNAYYNCARCDDFYCSADCQKTDWPVHKLNCFPMPELVPSRIHQNLIDVKPTKKPAREAAPVHSSNDRTVDATASISNGTNNAHETNHEKTKSPQQKMHATTNGNNNAAAAVAPQSSTTPAAISLPTTQRIPNDAEVFITYVRSHQKIYIRSVATDNAYKALMNDVFETALIAPPLQSRPETDSNVLVLAPYDGIYYRGLVLPSSTTARTVRVAFIDFGNTEDVPFDKLKVLPDELCQRPRLTLLVNLKNVSDDLEAGDASVMKLYLESISELGESAHVLKVRGEKEFIEKNQTVELIDLHTGQSINDKLNFMLE